MTDDVLRIEPLTKGRWQDVVALFGTRGDPSWCWCQYFLTTGKGYTERASANRRAFRAQVTAGDRPPGLLAYAGDVPVGWVQLGPRPAYPRVCATRTRTGVADDDLADPGVWSVTCFVVKVGHRRRGVAGALLAAAVEHARAAGAHTLEGHPVDVSARAGRVGGAELYHGVASTFAAAGFEEVGRTGATRPVMRIKV